MADIRLDTALWKYRLKLNVNSSKVKNDYSAFAVLLIWTAETSNIPSYLIDGGAYSALNGGGDLRFSIDAAGLTELPFDVVTFDTVNYRAEIWVKLPSLSTIVDTAFYLWWGYSLATQYSSSHSFGRYNAFPGWNMVYHGDDTGSTNMNNSVGSSFNMTNSGTSVVNGVIGKARSFNGSSNYMYINGGLSAGNPNFGTYWTAMGWVYWNSFAEQGSRIIDFGNGAGQDNFEIHHDSGTSPVTGSIHLFNNTNNYYRQDTNLWSTGAWKHFIYTWDGSAGTLNLYINGVVVGSATSAPSWLRDAARPNCYLGKSNWAGDGYLNGYLDEIRIGNSIASEAYTKSAYAAQSSPETFIYYDERFTIPIFPIGWKQELILTQNHTKCSLGAPTYSNFTTPFVWTGSQGTSNLDQQIFTSGLGANSDGSDIRFSSDVGGLVQLPFEIVSFNNTGTPSTSSAEIWVKVPSISSSVDIKIYVWWGKSDALPYQPTATYGQYAVWDSTSHKAVYHGDGVGSPATLADSTSNGYTLTNSGTTETTGYNNIGKARSCNGTTQYAAVSQNLGITSGDITEEVWFNAVSTTDTDDHSALVSHYDDGAKVDYRIFQWTTGIGVARHAPNILWNATDQTAISAGVWYRASLVYSGTTLSFYLNGTFQRSITVNTAGTGSYTTQLVIGRGTASAQTYFYGSLDEIRISNIARSTDWILTDYNSQNEPQTFWGVGPILSLIAGLEFGINS